jgi:outer membrane protein
MSARSTVPNILSTIAILIAVFGVYSLYKNKQKTGYVLIQEVFDKFELKKELAKQYEGIRNARKKILDSLQVDLSVLSRRISSKEKRIQEEIDLFERKKLELNIKMQEFDQSNIQMTKDFDEKIISQLNQYVSDFGKAKGYDMIFGNTSNGSIMYGTEKNNVTVEVIEFINEKYKGIK